MSSPTWIVCSSVQSCTKRKNIVVCCDPIISTLSATVTSVATDNGTSNCQLYAGNKQFCALTQKNRKRKNTEIIDDKNLTIADAISITSSSKISTLNTSIAYENNTSVMDPILLQERTNSSSQIALTANMYTDTLKSKSKKAVNAEKNGNSDSQLMKTIMEIIEREKTREMSHETHELKKVKTNNYRLASIDIAEKIGHPSFFNANLSCNTVCTCVPDEHSKAMQAIKANNVTQICDVMESEESAHHHVSRKKINKSSTRNKQKILSCNVHSAINPPSTTNHMCKLSITANKLDNKIRVKNCHTANDKLEWKSQNIILNTNIDSQSSLIDKNVVQDIACDLNNPRHTYDVKTNTSPFNSDIDCGNKVDSESLLVFENSHVHMPTHVNDILPPLTNQQEFDENKAAQICDLHIVDDIDFDPVDSNENIKQMKAACKHSEKRRKRNIPCTCAKNTAHQKQSVKCQTQNVKHGCLTKYTESINDPVRITMFNNQQNVNEINEDLKNKQETKIEYCDANYDQVTSFSWPITNTVNQIHKIDCFNNPTITNDLFLGSARELLLNNSDQDTRVELPEQVINCGYNKEKRNALQNTRELSKLNIDVHKSQVLQSFNKVNALNDLKNAVKTREKENKTSNEYLEYINTEYNTHNRIDFPKHNILPAKIAVEEPNIGDIETFTKNKILVHSGDNLHPFVVHDNTSINLSNSKCFQCSDEMNQTDIALLNQNDEIMKNVETLPISLKTQSVICGNTSLSDALMNVSAMDATDTYSFSAQKVHPTKDNVKFFEHENSEDTYKEISSLYDMNTETIDKHQETLASESYAVFGNHAQPLNFQSNNINNLSYVVPHKNASAEYIDHILRQNQANNEGDRNKINTKMHYKVNGSNLQLMPEIISYSMSTPIELTNLKIKHTPSNVSDNNDVHVKTNIIPIVASEIACNSLGCQNALYASSNLSLPIQFIATGASTFTCFGDCHVSHEQETSRLSFSTRPLMSISHDQSTCVSAKGEIFSPLLVNDEGNLCSNYISPEQSSYVHQDANSYGEQLSISDDIYDYRISHPLAQHLAHYSSGIHMHDANKKTILSLQTLVASQDSAEPNSMKHFSEQPPFLLEETNQKQRHVTKNIYQVATEDSVQKEKLAYLSEKGVWRNEPCAAYEVYELSKDMILTALNPGACYTAHNESTMLIEAKLAEYDNNNVTEQSEKNSIKTQYLLNPYMSEHINSHAAGAENQSENKIAHFNVCEVSPRYVVSDGLNLCQRSLGYHVLSTDIASTSYMYRENSERTDLREQIPDHKESSNVDSYENMPWNRQPESMSPSDIHQEEMLEKYASEDMPDDFQTSLSPMTDEQFVADDAFFVTTLDQPSSISVERASLSCYHAAKMYYALSSRILAPHDLSREELLETLRDNLKTINILLQLQVKNKETIKVLKQDNKNLRKVVQMLVLRDDNLRTKY